MLKKRAMSSVEKEAVASSSPAASTSTSASGRRRGRIPHAIPSGSGLARSTGSGSGPVAPVAVPGQSRVSRDAKGPEDLNSVKGRFGYFTDPDGGWLFPYILRRKVKYVSVRISERHVLQPFLAALPSDVVSCFSDDVQSYYMHEAEYKVFNDINVKHNDCLFGMEAFSTRDLVVRLDDVLGVVRFLHLCHKKLVIKQSHSEDPCGFIRIDETRLVPYTLVGGIKQVPVFYFEGDTQAFSSNASDCTGWPLAYLKFCCKVQDVRNELFAVKTCRVVPLEDMQRHFSKGKAFDEYWPESVPLSLANPRTPRTARPASWVRKPSSTAQGAQAAQTGLTGQTAQTAPRAKPVTTNAINTTSTPQTVRQQIFRPYMANTNTVRSLAAPQTPQAPQAPLAPLAIQPERPADATTLYRAMREQSIQMQRQQQFAMHQQLHHQQQHQLRRHQFYQHQIHQHQIHQHQLQQHQLQQLQQLQPLNLSEFLLTQMPEALYDQSQSSPPYKPHLITIEKFHAFCFNVHPHVVPCGSHELLLPLPELVRYFFYSVSLEEMHHMLRQLNVTQYRGNRELEAALRSQAKYAEMEMVPLVFLHDAAFNLPALRRVISSRATQPVHPLEPAEPPEVARLVPTLGRPAPKRVRVAERSPP